MVVQIFEDDGSLFQLSEKPDGTIETERIGRYKRSTTDVKFCCNDNISAIWNYSPKNKIQCQRIGGTNTDTTQGQDVSFFKEGITGKITYAHVFDDGILAVIFGDLKEILWLKSDSFGKIEKVNHLEIPVPHNVKCTECDRIHRFEEIISQGKATTHTGSDSFVSREYFGLCDCEGIIVSSTYIVVNSSHFTTIQLTEEEATKRLSGTSESLEFEIGSLGPLKFTREWKIFGQKVNLIYRFQNPRLKSMLKQISQKKIKAITQAHSQGLESNPRSSSHSLKPSLEQRVANLESTIQDLHATLNEIMSNLNK